jgi:hypothetical protein
MSMIQNKLAPNKSKIGAAMPILFASKTGNGWPSGGTILL